MKVALISCSKKKNNYECEAYELYMPSDLFRYSYEFAKTFADKIYILSAKYGLLAENEMVKPYDVTLNNMSEDEKKTWAQEVIEQLNIYTDIKRDDYYIFAGKNYYQYILSDLTNKSLPLGNRPLGARISYLKELLEGIDSEKDFISYKSEDQMNLKYTEVSRKLHRYFNSLKRYHYDSIKDIPFENGIYIMFEDGEKYGEYDRVVRVGTHDSPNRLKNRLRDHFLKENKDGSIFRKNIGRAILSKRNDCYLDIWNIDTSRVENKKYIHHDIQAKIEKEVSDYLRSSVSFACFQVDDKYQRLRLEKGIIATLNSDKEFISGKDWLGNYSKENEISTSGMWLKIGLDHKPLNDEELDYILKNDSSPLPIEEVTIRDFEKNKVYKKDQWNIETIWGNIKKYEGEIFYTKSKMDVVYEVNGNILRHNRAKIPLTKSDFEKVIPYLPLSSLSEIKEFVTGPSYIYAILSDKRIIGE